MTREENAVQRLRTELVETKEKLRKEVERRHMVEYALALQTVRLDMRLDVRPDEENAPDLLTDVRSDDGTMTVKHCPALLTELRRGKHRMIRWRAENNLLTVYMPRNGSFLRVTK